MDKKDSYMTKIDEKYKYVTTMNKLGYEIFSVSPVRVREKKKLQYYEIGALNISDSGAIIIKKNDKLKRFANETSLNRQSLRVGDIVVPFRHVSKFGVIVETPEITLVPNTSMIVIRTNSDIDAASLCTFLNQQFVLEHLFYLMRDSAKKQLSVEMLSSLIIPELDRYATKEDLSIRIEIQRHYDEIRRLSLSLSIY